MLNHLLKMESTSGSSKGYQRFERRRGKGPPGKTAMQRERPMTIQHDAKRETHVAWARKWAWLGTIINDICTE